MVLPDRDPIPFLESMYPTKKASYEANNIKFEAITIRGWKALYQRFTERQRWLRRQVLEDANAPDNKRKAGA